MAKADFFPQLDLTGLFGAVSPELSAFTSDGGVAWGIAAGLTGPLFHGGQLRAQYAQARAVRDQYALQYQQTVLNAFQEVSDALISREKSAGARTEQSRAVEAYKIAVKISMERYRMGSADYYEVLQEQQLLFPAENSLVQFHSTNCSPLCNFTAPSAAAGKRRQRSPDSFNPTQGYTPAMFRPQMDTDSLCSKSPNPRKLSLVASTCRDGCASSAEQGESCHPLVSEFPSNLVCE